MTTVSAIAGVILNVSVDILVKFFFFKPLIVCVVIFVGSHL